MRCVSSLNRANGVAPVPVPDACQQAHKSRPKASASLQFVQIETENIIRVFPVRTNWTPDDELSFVGPPPLFRPGTPETPVHVSVTFTWHRAYAEKLAESWGQFYRNVRIGGPAYDDPGGVFVPGRYLKKGCTITSRGCPKKCGWCSVPRREGGLRYLPITPGWIVQDNNLLACEEAHLRAVFEMLQRQERKIYFNGGLDKHFLREWHRELFDSIPIGELWFACDQGGDDLRWLERAARILDGIPLRKRRCYTMIGYNGESLSEAERRIESVFALGFMPFSQLYQPPDAKQPAKIYSSEWKALNRKWSRPAAYMKGEAETDYFGQFDFFLPSREAGGSASG